MKTGATDAAIAGFTDVFSKHPGSPLAPTAELEAGRATVRDMERKADHPLAIALDDGGATAAIRALGEGDARGG